MRACSHAAGIVGMLFVIPAMAAAEPPKCPGVLGQSELVHCALEQSLELRRAVLELSAISGRKTEAETILPSRPVLSVSGGQRSASSGPETAFDWYVTLSQELELAGQRGLRLDIADAERTAQLRRMTALGREIAAQALTIYVSLAAARERAELSATGARIAERLGVLAEERLKSSLIAAVDVDVAKADGIRLALDAFDAQREVALLETDLTGLLGGEPREPSDINTEGALLRTEPATLDAASLVASALATRADLAVADAEQKSAEARIALVRRERIPNLTVSLTAERDGFGERFLGVGLAIPLPLPSVLASNRTGFIAEAEALHAQAETDVASVRRRVTVEVQRAVASRRSRAAVLQLIPADLVTRARRDLEVLSEAITSRQLSIREALLAQRSLIELLQADVAARFQVALADIELARAAGLPLPGAQP